MVLNRPDIVSTAVDFTQIVHIHCTRSPFYENINNKGTPGMPEGWYVCNGKETSTDDCDWCFFSPLKLFTIY